MAEKPSRAGQGLQGKYDRVEAFPLSVDNVIFDYNRIPADATDIYYHYTDWTGFQGILQSGGLRATYRRMMNDDGEFRYARRVVYDAIREVAGRDDLPYVRKSLTEWCEKNLDRELDESKDSCSAYCACLTISPDEKSQWHDYADNGKGVAIGLSAYGIFYPSVWRITEGKPWLLCLPVLYEEDKQREFVSGLFQAGISDIQRYLAQVSTDAHELTALRDRIMREITVVIISFIDFIKDSRYASEREMRLILGGKDIRNKAKGVQFYDRCGESIPYLFFDLRNPTTGRLRLAELKVGPNASFPEALVLIERTLDEVGYGSGGFYDRPRIVPSKLPPFQGL